MARLNEQIRQLNNIYGITSTISKMIGLITYLRHSLHSTTQNIQRRKKHHSLQTTDTTHFFVVNRSTKIDLFQKTRKTKSTKWGTYTRNSHEILILWTCEVQSITTNTKKRDQPLKGGRKYFYSAEISKRNDQARSLTTKKSDHSQLKKKSDKWIIVSSYRNLWSEFIQYSTYRYSNLHQKTTRSRCVRKVFRNKH